MADLKTSKDEMISKIAGAIELLTLGPRADVSDSERKDEIKTSLAVIKNLDEQDIKFHFETDKELHDQILNLNQLAKSIAFNNNVANVSLVLTAAFLVAGILLAAPGTALTAIAAGPTIGPFIYAAALPGALGIATSWRAQAILNNSFDPQVALLLQDLNNPITQKVKEIRSERLQESRVEIEPESAVVAAPTMPKGPEPITPAANAARRPQNTDTTSSENEPPRPSQKPNNS